MVNNKQAFSVENFEFIEEDIESQFATVEIEAFSSGESRHDLTCSVELLKATAHTLYEKPIVFEKDVVLNDFGSHTDNENERRIAGFIVPDTAEFFDRSDGRVGLKVQGKLWKYYAQWALDTFKSAANMAKKISVEMLMGDPDGNSMTNFEYTGVALLGEFITEASPGAQARLLSFSDDDYQEAYDKEFSPKEFAKYSEIDFAISKGMKRNAKLGLELRAEKGSGGTAVAVSMAKYLVREATLSPEKAKQIAKYFARPAVSFPSDKDGDDWVSWNLYGGKSGAKLARKIVEEIQAEDEKLLAYFDKLPPVDAGNEEKEDFMKDKKEEENKDEKEVEVFEEAKPEDDEVMMEKEAEMEKDKEEAEEKEDMAEEKSEAKEDEEEMAAPEEKDEVKEMGCDEKKYENLFAELTITHEALKIEAVELREFKSGIEKQQFDIRISAMLGKVKHLFDEDGLSGLREDATKNYSLGTVGAWENIVKAKGFEISEKLPPVEKDDDGIVKMGLIDADAKKPVYDSMWD